MILVPPGSRAGYVYTTLTADTDTRLTADRDFLVREIRFDLAAGIGATTAVKIYAEGQDLFGGQQVPLVLLNSAWSANPQAAAPAGNGSIFRPDTPIAWTKDFPLVFRSASTLRIVVLADPVIPPQRA